MTSELLERSCLNDDERMEYIQINDFYKHDDNMAYRLASILLPLSFGAFVVAQTQDDRNIKFALFLFSIAIYMWWALSSERTAWYSKIRMSRARELEEKADLWHHRRINNPTNELKCKLGNCLKIRRLRWIFFLILVICWSGLFLLDLCQ